MFYLDKLPPRSTIRLLSLPAKQLFSPSQTRVTEWLRCFFQVKVTQVSGVRISPRVKHFLLFSTPFRHRPPRGIQPIAGILLTKKTKPNRPHPCHAKFRPRLPRPAPLNVPFAKSLPFPTDPLPNEPAAKAPAPKRRLDERPRVGADVLLPSGVPRALELFVELRPDSTHRPRKSPPTRSVITATKTIIWRHWKHPFRRSFVTGRKWTLKDFLKIKRTRGLM